MIRKTGNHAIQVDQTPKGEPVLRAALIRPGVLTSKTQALDLTRTQTASAKLPWPKGDMKKPVIRASTRLGSRASIPTRPEIFGKTKTIAALTPAPSLSPIVVKPTDSPEEPEMETSATQTAPVSPPIQAVIAPPHREFTIQPTPMVMVAGHSVGGLREIPFPNILPEEPDRFVDRGRSLVPALLIVLVTGTLGWNVIRYTASVGAAGSRHAEVVDRVAAHAMAPLRNVRTADDDEPSAVRAKTGHIEVYNGPGRQFSVVGKIGANERYPILEKKMSWIKLALDHTHSAWVNENAVELLR
jgi:hypothetical protein